MDNTGQHCTRTRVCGLNGCREVHHRLLHLGEKKSDKTGSEKRSDKGLQVQEKCQQDNSVCQSSNTTSQKVVSTGGETKKEEAQANTTMVSETAGNIALRTVPVEW